MRTGEHSGWTHALFYLGFALLVAHEMDAVARHEWRLLPGLSLLDDGAAEPLFILLHVPVFAALFWLTGHRSDRVRRRSQIGVDIFLVGHGLVHFAFIGHALYEFAPPVETVTVYGAAVVGLVHLGLVLRSEARAAA